MTIKQNGGIFGRNPTFNNVTVDGTLAVDQIVEKTGAAGITLDGVTLKDGNVVLSSGNGIDFSATSGTGTSELFDDYEEGTWTPVVASSVGTITTYTVYSARYTKVGRVVVLSCQFFVSDNGTGSGVLNISGFPFTNAAATPGVIYNQSTGKSGTVSVSTSATSGDILYYDATYPVATGQTIQFSLTYSE